MDCSTTSLVSNQIINYGATKTCSTRTSESARQVVATSVCRTTSDGVCAASVNYLLQNKYMSLGSLSNSIGYDLLRTILPSIIPSSYRGATIRYLYYIRCMLSGQSLVLENGHSHE
ncbi:uncharacterized protein LOC131322638 isoform X2 [Rhododendron vialii]|uniref:uncharacterized protein LOC131322638 isoform X2 n=1 Tax=Rhododendron vialii TaxID=182163 RepID=UPI00265FCBAB|nr:uncharacterized protein LOC131322638 isoform X2 [Rhododendron vialii]